jgi:hypothetical protein
MTVFVAAFFILLRVVFFHEFDDLNLAVAASATMKAFSIFRIITLLSLVSVEYLFTA